MGGTKTFIYIAYLRLRYARSKDVSVSCQRHPSEGRPAASGRLRASVGHLLRLLGYALIARFHKATSSFDRVDDEEAYELKYRSYDAFCNVGLTASVDAYHQPTP